MDKKAFEEKIKIICEKNTHRYFKTAHEIASLIEPLLELVKAQDELIEIKDTILVQNAARAISGIGI
jgi:hypothetical protein